MDFILGLGHSDDSGSDNDYDEDDMAIKVSSDNNVVSNVATADSGFGIVAIDNNSSHDGGGNDTVPDTATVHDEKPSGDDFDDVDDYDKGDNNVVSDMAASDAVVINNEEPPSDEIVLDYGYTSSDVSDSDSDSDDDHDKDNGRDNDRETDTVSDNESSNHDDTLSCSQEHDSTKDACQVSVSSQPSQGNEERNKDMDESQPSQSSRDSTTTRQPSWPLRTRGNNFRHRRNPRFTDPGNNNRNPTSNTRRIVVGNTYTPTRGNSFGGINRRHAHLHNNNQQQHTHDGRSERRRYISPGPRWNRQQPDNMQTREMHDRRQHVNSMHTREDDSIHRRINCGNTRDNSSRLHHSGDIHVGETHDRYQQQRQYIQRRGHDRRQQLYTERRQQPPTERRQQSPTERRQQPPTERRQQPPTERRQQPPTERRQQPRTTRRQVNYREYIDNIFSSLRSNAENLKSIDDLPLGGGPLSSSPMYHLSFIIKKAIECKTLEIDELLRYLNHINYNLVKMDVYIYAKLDFDNISFGNYLTNVIGRLIENNVSGFDMDVGKTKIVINTLCLWFMYNILSAINVFLCVRNISDNASYMEFYTFFKTSMIYYSYIHMCCSDMFTGYYNTVLHCSNDRFPSYKEQRIVYAFKAVFWNLDLLNLFMLDTLSNVIHVNKRVINEYVLIPHQTFISEQRCDVNRRAGLRTNRDYPKSMGYCYNMSQIQHVSFFLP